MFMWLAQQGYNVVTNPYHSLQEIKKTHREMFSQTNYMKILQKKDSTKNHVISDKILQKFIWL